MSVWNLYTSRITAKGATKRDASLHREVHMLNTKLKDNLSYQNVLIDDVERNVAIINSDNLNEKNIYSLPGEDIICGGLVRWMDNYWLITERDANTTVYTKAKMLQCNYLLKWVDDEDNICEQWCVIEDGTKYLTGEYEDRNFVITRGDSRIAITMPRNTNTAKLDREKRFLIDDPLSKNMLAYTLSKPLKIGHTYNNDGVFSFVLQEVTTTKYDNQELGIADYYKHFDASGNLLPEPQNNSSSDERKVWL